MSLSIAERCRFFDEQEATRNAGYDAAVKSRTHYPGLQRPRAEVDAGLVTFPNHDREDVTGADWEDIWDGAETRWEIREREKLVREVGGAVVVEPRGRRLQLSLTDRVDRHRLRARLRGAAGTLTPRQWRETLERFDYECAYCGKTGRLQIEHVVPILHGGGTDLGNVVPACRRCNRDKWTLPLNVFLGLYPKRARHFLARIVRVNEIEAPT